MTGLQFTCFVYFSLQGNQYFTFFFFFWLISHHVFLSRINKVHKNTPVNIQWVWECNLFPVTSCRSGCHAAHRASCEEHYTFTFLPSHQLWGLCKTHLQKHRLHHAAALQVHHRHGWHGVHRALQVQGGLLRAPHRLHHPHLHPAAQHADRPHEPHRGADRHGEHLHLAATGEVRPPRGALWRYSGHLFMGAVMFSMFCGSQRAITILDMEKRLPCCLKSSLRSGVEKNLSTAQGDDRRWCFRLVHQCDIVRE